jgi:hypothetical protein
MKALKEEPGIQPGGKLTWKDFIQGRLDTTWRKTIEDHYRINNYKNKTTFNGKQWGKSLIMVLWENLHKIWLTRNQKQNAKETENDTKFAYQDTTKQVTELYKYKDRVSARDRNQIFPESLEDMLKHQIPYLQDWLTTYKEVITQAADEAEKECWRTNKCIIDYKHKPG